MTSRWQLLMSTIFYVDNFLAEADTPQDLLKLQQQLRDLLLKRGFDIRKWRSNSSAVMEEIPQELHDPSLVKSTLLHNLRKPWESTGTCTFVSVGKLTNLSTTKCSIVSDIAGTFDVLGWFTPSTILMKIPFQ